MGRKKILIWEIIGTIFIIIFGSLFHFIYEISGFLKPVALIGAVNESTWEHIKIGFWPAFIFAIIEFIVFGKKIRTFIFAKSISFLIITFLIPALFYLYVFITGGHNLIVDILIFIVAVIAAQITSYYLTVMEKYHVSLLMIGIILLVAEVLAFSLFTYFPPKFELFRDPIYGSFGINNLE